MNQSEFILVYALTVIILSVHRCLSGSVVGSTWTKLSEKCWQIYLTT